MFQLTTFGGLLLRRADDGAPVGGPRRKPLAVLALLAVAGEEGVARDRVVSLLWPDVSLERGRRSLAQTLYALRQETGHPDLVAGDATLRLDHTVLRCDAAAFTAALARGDDGEALRLHAGPFLDGVFFRGCAELDRWMEVERARLARAFAAAAGRVGEARARVGDLSGAASAWRLAFDVDPLDSDAARALAGALDGAGDRAGALRVVHAHELLIGEQAGAVPDARFQRFAARLRAGESSRDRVDAVPPEDAPPAAPQPGDRLDVVAGAPSEGADPEGGARNRARWRLPAVAAALAGVAVLGAIAAARLPAGTRARPTTGAAARPAPRWAAPPSGGAVASVAVLPFEAVGSRPDPLLSEGVARLVAIAIDDVAGIRSVDVGAALRQLGETGVASPGDAARVAARLGADFFVRGTAVRSGDRLRLAVTLHATARPEHEEASARAEVPAARLFAGVDSLALLLLAARETSAPGRLVSPAARTTASLDAFKAFLEGERAFRTGRYGEAVAAFRRAVAEDTTFALAYYRMATAADWAAEGAFFESALRRARALAHRLPERERLLVTGSYEWQWGSTAAAERALRRAIELYPDDPEASYQLGEVLFHSGYAVGRPPDEARPLFARVARLEPDNAEALAHLMRADLRTGRIDEADSLARRVRALRGPADRLASEAELTVAMARGDRARLVRVADSVSQGAGDLSLLELAVWRIAAYTDSAQLAALFARRLVDRSSDVLLRSRARLRFAEFAALAGDADSTLARASDPTQGAWWMLGTRGYLAALPGVRVPRARLAALVDSLRRWPDRRPWPGALVDPDANGFTADLRGWPLGLLSAALGDTLGIAAAAAELDRVRTESHARLARSLAASLRARLAWARGDRDGALRLLDGAMGDAPLYARLDIFGGYALDRWQRAEWLRAMGRYAEAVRWYRSFGQDAAGELPFARVAALGAAAAYDAAGDRAAAARERARAGRLASTLAAELR